MNESPGGTRATQSRLRNHSLCGQLTICNFFKTQGLTPSKTIDAPERLNREDNGAMMRHARAEASSGEDPRKEAYDYIEHSNRGTGVAHSRSERKSSRVTRNWCAAGRA